MDEIKEKESIDEIHKGDTVLVKMKVEEIGDYCDDYLLSFPDGSIARWMDEEYIQPLSGKRGHWERNTKNFITCTCCYRTFVDNGQNWNYCPICGTMMNGE